MTPVAFTIHSVLASQARVAELEGELEGRTRELEAHRQQLEAERREKEVVHFVYRDW